MRLTGRVTNLERSAAVTRDSRQGGAVVIYDPQTGAPLPGHEPSPRLGVTIWIPDNGRTNDDAEER